MPKKTSGLIDLPFRVQPKRLRLKPAVAAARGPGARAARGPVDLPFAGQVGAGADMRRNDCGPACVRMGLDFLGLAKGVTIDTLAAQVDASDDGTTAEDLVALAKTFGADAFVVNVGAAQLPEPPAILLVRYSGYDRATVQDKRFWDLSAGNPNILHWAWWLGNTTLNGKTVSVWNDPLFTGLGGKNLVHGLDALERAYVPYFGSRVAVKFTGVFNPPSGGGAALTVTPRDADGVNLRTSPEIRPDNLIRRVVTGTPLKVLEDADGARVKMSSGQQIHWLRVQTPDNVSGFVAAWLVMERVAPVSDLVSMKTVLARGSIVMRNAPNGAVVWGLADGAPLRVLSSNGSDWPNKIGNAGAWLEVESYALKRGFVRGDVIGLPAAADTRVPVDDARLKFGDSAWLYGVHDDFGARRAELFGAKKGWVLFTEDVGGSGSSAYTAWAADPTGFGVLVRLNNGYNDGFRGPGTIPGPAGYDAFAQKCAGWAQRTMAGLSSDYACTFVIGNEMNNPREWPNPNGSAHEINFGAAITPQGYADCFNRVYRAIKAAAPNARVVPGAVDPYNALYLDCLQYFTQMLARIEALDGFSFHTYTHGPEVSRITSLGTFQNDPLRWQYYDFMSYTTLMDQIPAKWRNLPVYITETDQTPTEQNPNAWTGGRNGWVRAAYQELARWNAQPLAQQIQALILYRWARGGGSDAAYCLQDKPDILAELKDTVAATDLRWRWAAPGARRAVPVAPKAAPKATPKATPKKKRRKRKQVKATL